MVFARCGKKNNVLFLFFFFSFLFLGFNICGVSSGEIRFLWGGGGSGIANQCITGKHGSPKHNH